MTIGTGLITYPSKVKRISAKSLTRFTECENDKLRFVMVQFQHVRWHLFADIWQTGFKPHSVIVSIVERPYHYGDLRVIGIAIARHIVSVAHFNNGHNKHAKQLWLYSTASNITMFCSALKHTSELQTYYCYTSIHMKLFLHHCLFFRCWAALTLCYGSKQYFMFLSSGMQILKHFNLFTLASRGTLPSVFWR